MKRITPAAAVLLMTVGLAAQDGQAPPTPSNRPPAPPLVSLKVSLVLSRYQGDKKISSVPYTLWTTTNEGRTSMRMGTQIPVVTTVFSKDATGDRPQASYNYKDVGTNIDCGATTVADGAYKLLITIQDSSVYYPDQADSATQSATAVTRAPAFRSFNSTFVLVLKDGQTAQSTSATDPISGQVLKIDATVNVQK